MAEQVYISVDFQKLDEKYNELSALKEELDAYCERANQLALKNGEPKSAGPCATKMGAVTSTLYAGGYYFNQLVSDTQQYLQGVLDEFAAQDASLANQLGGR